MQDGLKWIAPAPYSFVDSTERDAKKEGLISSFLVSLDEFNLDRWHARLAQVPEQCDETKHDDPVSEPARLWLDDVLKVVATDPAVAMGLALAAYLSAKQEGLRNAAALLVQKILRDAPASAKVRVEWTKRCWHALRDSDYQVCRPLIGTFVELLIELAQQDPQQAVEVWRDINPNRGAMDYAFTRFGAEESLERFLVLATLLEPCEPGALIDGQCRQVQELAWSASRTTASSSIEASLQAADRLWQLLQRYSSKMTREGWLENCLYALLSCGCTGSPWRQEALHWFQSIEASKSEVKALSLRNLVLLARNVDALVEASRRWLFDALREWGGQYRELFPVGQVNERMRMALETGAADGWLSEDWEALCKHSEAWTQQLLRPMEGSVDGFWPTGGDNTSCQQLYEMAHELRREWLSFAKARNSRIFLKLLLVDVQIAYEETARASTLEATELFEPAFWNACVEDPWIGAETLTLLWLRGHGSTGRESLAQMYYKLERPFAEAFPALAERVQKTHQLGPARFLYR